MKRIVFSAAVMVFAAAFADVTVVRIKAEADHATCRYTAGETSKVTFTAFGTNGVKLTSGKLTLKVDNFGNRVISERTVDLALENPFSASAKRTEPGFLRYSVLGGRDMRVEHNPGNVAAGGYVYGVGYDVAKIKPGTPNPADFDEFWKNAIAECERTVPLDPQLELIPDKCSEECDYFRVSFATVQGRRVHGFLSRPKDLAKGPYPVNVTVPGAGPGATGTWNTPGKINFVMNVHTYAAPLQPGPELHRLDAEQEAKYSAPCGVNRYCRAGIHKSREDYFYYASILGINRAVNWLAAQEWSDKRNFSYGGTSQGGGFGLILTALNRHFTRSSVYVPAITDLLGFRVEDRQSGWPWIVEQQKDENKAAAEKWAPYFCGVNFARRITTPIRFVVGFSDNVCSPNAVYSAYNMCPAKDKEISDGIGMGHDVRGEFYQRFESWRMQASIVFNK